ncbi:HIRAN domain-containing protein [Microbacterium sp. RD1]|uniref:HIRAN domain-containing protein n=1 Tax=Microbacterium sp. RD1 TaxID=3457313 RepID=UPI003FA5A19D
MPAWWEHLLHVTTGRVRSHDDLPDLRHLPSRRVAVERTHFLVNDRERRHQDRRLYVLRREPRSHRHATSIAVFSNGRGVGYLPERVSRDMAPLLDALGGAAIVNGAGTRADSMRLRVDLPTHAALRAFAA